MPIGYKLPIPDREILYNLYWIKGLSQGAIAKRLGVGKSSVGRWMRRLNVPQRQLNPNMYKDWTGAPHRDAEVLRRMYWDEELNTVQIAERLGISHSVIGLWMERLGIPRRDQALATHMAIGNSVQLSEEALAFLQGELLGDGSIVMNKSISGAYHHCNKHRAYLEWLIKEFDKFGIESVGKINRMSKSYKGKEYFAYSFCTRSYPEFKELREKWYSSELGKQPPDDLRLNGLILRQWFIGDGNYRARRHRGGKLEHEIRILNLSFTFERKEFLANQLQSLGILSTFSPRGFRIRNQSFRKFFETIGPCPVPEIYGYKWPRTELGKQLELF